MSLDSKQFEERIKYDDELFINACERMAGVVAGEKRVRAYQDDKVRVKNAINEICKYYHVKPRDIPADITDVNEQLEYSLHDTGIMRRKVKLKGAWYKDAVGAMLGVLADGKVVALLPGKFGGYSYLDPASGERVCVNKATAGNVANEAICFYRALPLRSIGNAELFGFIAQCLAPRDIIAVALLTLVSTLIMLVTPMVSRLLYAGAQAGAPGTLLVSMGAPLISAVVAKALIDMTKALTISRVTTKAGVAMQAACMMRLLSLPADFFKEYSAGELASRANGVSELCGDLVGCLMTLCLTPMFSLVFLIQMGKYGAALMPPAILTLLVIAAVAAMDIVLRAKRELRISLLAAKEEGVTFALMTSVRKVKLAGAEKRAFAGWADAYVSHASLTYNPPRIIKVTGALIAAATLAGVLAVYYFAISANVRLPDYIAFNAAFGMLGGTFASFSGMTTPMSRIASTLFMLKPLLSTVPEISQKRRPVVKLTGLIEICNVTFRYSENMPSVINDLSLKITPGEYVAIVGGTGCGKSTLIRLLLGFEKPQRGSIYYDGRDLSQIDQRSLRRRIGVVLQNGSLFQGDIYSNIVVSAPWLTLDDAWEAAEIAGLADDIREMPMGMNTVLSQGGATISGGQKQRIMIARAIAGKPDILFFDEATSALDNNTQGKITSALDALKCTRIVIAHRLSTIKQCGRVLVLDNGTIAESGTYQQLLDQNGIFSELVARQRMDDKRADKPC